MTPMRLPTTDVTDFGNPPGYGGPLRPGGERRALDLTKGQKRDLPSTLSPSAERQRPALTIMRDLFAGDAKLHEEGIKYLPQAPNEDSVNYRVRLQRAVFDNMFAHTIKGLAGFVFREPPVLGEDVPPAIVGDEEGKGGHWENIDLAGTHGDVFARDLAVDAMTAGHAAILVEYPQTNGSQTARDDGGRGGKIVGAIIRPYWVPIKKDNILSWRTVVENGRTVLTQLVIEEMHWIPDGQFGEVKQITYRVLYRENGVVGWDLLFIRPDKTVAVLDGGTYPTQDEIPIAEVVTSGRVSLFESEPPFYDLGCLNLAHYRQWSDYDTSIHKTCVPILFTSGFLMQDEQGNQITISANAGLNSPAPDGNAQYVTHSGASLAECKASLDELVQRIGALGLAALASSKRVAETATAKELDKGASDSALAVLARGIQDGLERALYFHARYMNLDDGGSVEMNTDFEDMVMDAPTMTAWGSLATALNLPPRIVIEALIEGGKLPEDTDVGELEREIEANAQAEADRAAEELQMTLDAKAKGPPVSGPKGADIVRGADGKASGMNFR